MFIGKKSSDAFNNHLAAALIAAFGVTDMTIAAEIVEGRSFRVQTAFGPMTGKLMLGERSYDSVRKYRVGWVAFRFPDPTACVVSPNFPGGERLNKWSGKWNWLFDGTPDNEYQVDFMVSSIRDLKPTGLITI
jgi:hypothetical protein